MTKRASERKRPRVADLKAEIAELDARIATLQAEVVDERARATYEREALARIREALAHGVGWDALSSRQRDAMRIVASQAVRRIPRLETRHG